MAAGGATPLVAKSFDHVCSRELQSREYTENKARQQGNAEHEEKHTAVQGERESLG